MALLDTSLVPHGKDMLVIIDQYDVSGFGNDVSWSHGWDEVDLNVPGAAKQFKLGQRMSTMQMTGVYDTSAEGLRAAFEAKLLATENALLMVGPGGSDVGDNVVIARANTKQYGTKATSADVVRANIDATCNGKVMHLAHILYKGTVAADANGTTVDASADRIGADGGEAFLHIVDDPTGSTPTLDALVQHSANGSDWSTLCTFAQASARGVERVTFSGAVYRYRRVVLDVEGTTPSFDIAVAVSEY